MEEQVQGQIEALARTAVLTDAADLQGLVALREQAVSIASTLDAQHADDIAEMARHVASLAEAIVMRTVEDADKAFKELSGVIDRLQRATGPDKPSAPVDRELLNSWIASCDGKISDLEGKVLALERSGGTDGEVLAEVRRTLHTIKGECGVLSLHSPQHVCHEAESLIDELTNIKAPVPAGPLLQVLDWLKTLVGRLAADPTAPGDSGETVLLALAAARPSAAPPDRKPEQPSPSPAAAQDDSQPVTLTLQPGTEENLSDFLCESKDHLSNSEEALLALEHDRGNRELINTIFRAFHTIKGVSGFMALTPIVSLAHSAEQLLDGARGGALSLAREHLDLILAASDCMSKLLGVLQGGKGPTQRELKALVARLDAAARGEIIAGGSPPPPAAPAQATPESESASKPRKADQTVKVSTTRMDSLVTMVGELVIAQQMVVQSVGAIGPAAQAAQRTLSHMSKMVRELQEVSMSLRMVNLKSTFQKMTRLVRDVSIKAGKQIDVLTEGEDVELDRNVVEAITDPLVHMIRNACDHGVEGPEDRRAAGKPPTGQVRLRAYHAGGSIVIEISDDGRGLRREKLLAKAKSKGILPADLNESAMSDGDVFALIFLPGFSTAEKVTDISGRGVGMDVVRRNIEALRGKVDIRSVPGQGTTFVLRLPLTLAIIDGMVVRVGSQRYILPTLSIQQSFRPRAGEVHTVVGAGEMVAVRGSMLPIYRLNRVLDRPDGAAAVADGLLIVMETHDARFCLMVDEIVGQQSVVIKSLTHTGQHVRGVSGGAILGDGRVALILEVSQIVSLAKESPAHGPEQNAAPACAGAEPTLIEAHS